MSYGRFPIFSYRHDFLIDANTLEVEFLQNVSGFLGFSKGQLFGKCSENFKEDGEISKIGHLKNFVDQNFQKMMALTRKGFQILSFSMNLKRTKNLASSHIKAFQIRCQ